MSTHLTGLHCTEDSRASCVQAMRKKLPPPENTLSQPSQQSQQHQQQDYLAPEDYVVQDEIFKVALCSLAVNYQQATRRL